MLAGDICPHSTQLLAELVPRRLGDARDSLFPYQATTTYVQIVGKHSMSAEVISRLAEIRAELGSGNAGSALAGEYLDCVLDKHDNRYRYETYLALPVLKPLISSHGAQMTAPRLAAFLVADAMRFELCALHGWHKQLPVARPSLDLVRKRLRKGARFVAPWSSHGDAPGRSLDSLLELAERPEQPEAARLLLDALPAATDADAALRIAVSVLPVDVLHDEYLFIRILQASEVTFVSLLDHLRAAIAAIQTKDAEGARTAVIAASQSLAQGGRLFSILATMRAEAFRRFRRFTEGASAIQSEHYKRFELLCGVPSARRLDSAAFSNVPGVQDEARGDPQTLTRAYSDARSQGWFGAVEWESIDAALDELEGTHQRWKTTHFRIAAKMLADAPGSGYTAGVPYLRELLDNRLFWAIPERAGRNTKGEADRKHRGE